MLIPSKSVEEQMADTSLSRRVNANSQPRSDWYHRVTKLIKKGEC